MLPDAREVHSELVLYSSTSVHNGLLSLLFDVHPQRVDVLPGGNPANYHFLYIIRILPILEHLLAPFLRVLPVGARLALGAPLHLQYYA